MFITPSGWKKPLWVSHHFPNATASLTLFLVKRVRNSWVWRFPAKKCSPLGLRNFPARKNEIVKTSRSLGGQKLHTIKWHTCRSEIHATPPSPQSQCPTASLHCHELGGHVAAAAPLEGEPGVYPTNPRHSANKRAVQGRVVGPPLWKFKDMEKAANVNVCQNLPLTDSGISWKWASSNKSLLLGFQCFFNVLHTLCKSTKQLDKCSYFTHLKTAVVFERFVEPNNLFKWLSKDQRDLSFQNPFKSLPSTKFLPRQLLLRLLLPWLLSFIAVNFEPDLTSIGLVPWTPSDPWPTAGTLVHSTSTPQRPQTSGQPQ